MQAIHIQTGSKGMPRTRRSEKGTVGADATRGRRRFIELDPARVERAVEQVQQMEDLPAPAVATHVTNRRADREAMLAFRVTRQLHERLKHAADQHRLGISAEIRNRLEASLQSAG